MNRLEQSKCYLRSYLECRTNTPWIASDPGVEERARLCLQDLDGMASDWNANRPYCFYYYPQKVLAVDSQSIL